MVYLPKNINQAIKSFRASTQIEPSREALLAEIAWAIKRICRFSLVEPGLVFPSRAELLFVERTLTPTYIEWLQSAVDVARSYRCILVGESSYQVLERRNNVVLVNDNQAQILTPEEFRELEASSAGPLQDAHINLGRMRLGPSASSDLWARAGGFPYFDFWAEKLDLCSDFVEPDAYVPGRIKKRLRSYRIAVQVATSPQIAAALRAYVAEVYPECVIPECADTLQAVILVLKTAELGNPAKPREPGSLPAPPVARAPSRRDEVPPPPVFTGDQFQWQDAAQRYMLQCEHLPTSKMYECGHTIYRALIRKLEEIGVILGRKAYEVLEDYARGPEFADQGHVCFVEDWADMQQITEELIDELLEDHEYFVTYVQDPTGLGLVRKMEWLSIRALAVENGTLTTPVFTGR